MKYVSFVMALLLSFAISLPVSASPIPTEKDVTLRVKSVSEMTLEVALINLQQERTSITLQDLNGYETFFSEVVKNHNGYRKHLNLEELRAGRYILTVEHNGKKLQQVIVINEDLGIMLSDIVG